jgi:S-layer homology domain/Bacterial TSP3 repeat
MRVVQMEVIGRKVIVLLKITLLLLLMPSGTFAHGNGSTEQLPNYFDIQNHWAKDSISRLIHQGIVEGVNEHGVMLVKPDAPITRAEFITMLVKSMYTREELANELKRISAYSFQDTSRHWANHYIELANRMQISSGYPDGMFRPEKPISRAEMAALTVKAANVMHAEQSEQYEQMAFQDLSKSHWAYQLILTAAQNKLIAGFPDGTFKPEVTTKRAEAMVVITAMLQRQNPLPPSLGSTPASLIIPEASPKITWILGPETYGRKITPHTTIILEIKVSDPNNDLAAVHWEAGDGSISKLSDTLIKWTSPSDEGEYAIQVVARDTKGHSEAVQAKFQVVYVEAEEEDEYADPIHVIEDEGSEDSDGDGLLDSEEEDLGTNPFAEDTDDDGLSDYFELHIYETDPLNPDTDGDGIMDGVVCDSQGCGK